MTKPIIKHTYDSVASSLQESGANEAIHNVAYFNALLPPSLRDSALAESWQSTIKHKVNITMESLKESSTLWIATKIFQIFSQ
ncbi:hypothetical protein [Helicobacter rodentium]|uniref:hypothetical protein n=1 Tax=Helicobacter rodentium TaxID=59617 RepID=UPI0004790650|nr:hypothetical protein [Helicobacter rodentium]